MTTYTNPAKTLKAVIKYDSDWEEYIVKFYREGKYQKDADYHTDCKEDAHGTAKVFCEIAS